MDNRTLSTWHVENLQGLLEWVQDHSDFECTCDPGPEYEWDTNATTHQEECALEQEARLEWWLNWLAKGEE
jgi:hypothetical protein